MGGCEIGVQVAIDFTMSNGNAKNKTSLHYMDRIDSGNDYTEAINAVLSILENYDSDKQFPVFGFGAKMEALNGSVSHCFALNGNIFAPECNGVKGVLQAYWNAIHNIPLYGGTHFSGILEYVNGYAETIASDVSQHN